MASTPYHHDPDPERIYLVKVTQDRDGLWVAEALPSTLPKGMKLLTIPLASREFALSELARGMRDLVHLTGKLRVVS